MPSKQSGVCENWHERLSGHVGPPVYAVNGPWLDGNHGHKANQPWHTSGKLSNVASPGPAMIWVTLDENVVGLNDAEQVSTRCQLMRTQTD